MEEPAEKKAVEAPGKGLKKRFGVGKHAPPELRDLPKPSEEAQGMRANPVTYVARALFAKPGAGPKPLGAAPRKRSSAEKAKNKPKPVEAPKPAEAAPKPAEEAPEPTEEGDKDLAELLEATEVKGASEDLKEMGRLIQEAESKDLYNTEVPTAYVPQTRRGFSEFIKTTYKPFELPEGPINIPEGEKYYPYQKFVRDYMRMESPYRGVLVYHGLGSGKTCTAIAASEALFASAKKKIIVMTPFSLKRNFLNEISFCGFRHFQLNNFWVPLDPKDPTTVLFANQILGISGKYLKTARNVWVPDFRKPQSESNYNTLEDHDRAEIRAQILSIVEWHPEKNPSGRIRFISYNGISAKKLMTMACDEKANKFFDDAVIVVDEIHNLIRLMQGNIQAYLTKTAPSGKKVRRTVPIEEITHNRWSPGLCNQGTKLYTRGYLFYRLLLDARNSKIIGLSGTPLINFPEELGILSNVLHGYIMTIEGTIQQTGKEVQTKAINIGLEHPYTDFVRAKQDVKGGGTRVLFTLLPPGLRKIENEVGVERIPEEDETPTFEEIVESIRKNFADAGIPFSGKLTPASHELLPPFGDTFREKFTSGNNLKNKPILITRLTGLISYYKGSRLELMPRVKSDEIVRVPFSPYAQKAYSFKRATEVKSEMDAKGTKSIDAAFAKVYELGDSASANNYKMGSRQACNFAFPSEVTRPAANSAESKKEAEEGEAAAGIVTLAAEEEPEVEEELQLEDEDDDDAVAAAEEDAAVAEELYGEEEGERAPAASARKVPVSTGEETNALIREYYESRGEEVPEEYRDVGKRGDEALAAEYDRLAGAPRVPQPHNEEGYFYRGEAAAAAAPPTKGKTLKAKPKVKLEEGEAATEFRFGMDINNRIKVLSNMAPLAVTLQGQVFPTLEHYYQSLKFDHDPAWKKRVTEAPTGELARELGQSKEHKPEIFDEREREAYMNLAVRAKVNQNNLSDLLLSTGTKRLVQSEADKPANEKGSKYLQTLFMEIRKELDDARNMPPLADPQGGGGKTMAELRAEKAAKTAAAAAPPPAAPAPAPVKPRGKTLKVSAKPPAGAEDCKIGTKPGEKYKDACARARSCLKTLAKPKMTLGGSDGLANYSAKYAAMLERMAAAPGSSLVYSQFLDMEGIGIFRVAMEINGYAPIELTLVGDKVAFTPQTEASLLLGPGKQPRYLTFSGGEKPEVRRAALNIFNAKFSELSESMNAVLKRAGYTDNKQGELCRVFCITSAGAEGLSLRNVRAVHIMEPYWNEVRLRQVKGRAIRIGSHLDLPEDQRNVSIYTYISCFSEAAQKDRTGPDRILDTLLQHDSVDAKAAHDLGLPIKPGMTTYVLTTDEMIYTISERKRKIVESLECVMKAAAVDCELSIKQNGDRSFRCLPLKGKVGDFVYNPILDEDILEGSKYEGMDDICSGGLKPREVFQKINKVPYFLREILSATGEVTGYEAFEAKEVDDPKHPGVKKGVKTMPEKKLGTTGVRKVDGVDKPGPPVNIQKA